MAEVNAVVDPSARELTGTLAANVVPHGDRWGLQVTDATAALLEIEVGCVWSGVDLAAGARLLGVTQRPVRQSYLMASGKKAGAQDAQHQEQRYEFEHPVGPWQLIVRIAPDGVALRYQLPTTPGMLGPVRAGFELGPQTRVWAADYQSWYENPYGAGTAAQLPGRQLGCPLLARLDPDHYLLVTESEMDSWASGSHLLATSIGVRTHLDFQPADDELTVPPGWLTPWRVFIIASLAAVVASNLVDELAAPAESAPAGRPVRPGMAVWSWWSDHYSGSQFAAQRRFVDFAADLGWRHILVDCGWVEDWIPALVRYASRFGIGVHLWTRWTDLATPAQRSCLARWASWGVAGVKIDFMESESNQRYRWYLELLAETYRLGLLVNLHGSVIPRGWARRFPQLVSYEAVRANEYSSFYGMALPPQHNVILPFTRNVVGAMDFTPVAFSTALRATTDAHELATLVVFECGLSHLADDPDAYRVRPAAMTLLRAMPEVWRETVLLAGDPDSHAVLARHDGQRWFIGAISAGDARLLRVPLTALGPVQQCWLVTDGPDGLTSRQLDLEQAELVVSVPANGGFVAVIGDGPPPPRPQIRRQPPPVAAPQLLLDAAGTALVAVPEACQIEAEPGWQLQQVADRRWLVRGPAGISPGTSGIVTVRNPAGGISHIRLHQPLGTGRKCLSELPFIGFANHFGPVERDQSNGGGNPNDGGPLRIAGIGFEHGLGSCAPSSVRFFLGGQASRLRATVGIDDESKAGAAQVSVLLDDQPVHSCTVRSGRPGIPIDLSVTGAQTLTLVAVPELADQPSNPHVDWAEAHVVVEFIGAVEMQPRWHTIVRATLHDRLNLSTSCNIR